MDRLFPCGNLIQLKEVSKIISYTR